MADIEPDHGGLIAALQFTGRDGPVDILRPAPSLGGYIDGLPVFGCFPMVPFANRLTVPDLPMENGVARFPINWPSEGVAMHGVAFASAWQVESLQDDRVRLSNAIGDLDGRFLGTAKQDLSLSDDQGLQAQLSYRHQHEKAMIAGVGFHPWFHAPVGEVPFAIGFSAADRFEMGSDQFPVGYTRVDAKRIGLNNDDNGLDTCFAGWSGEAHLRRPSQSLAVNIRSDASILHCFIAGAFDAVCLEPVSHIPGAAHDARWRSKGPMRLLNTGEEISLEMTISAATCDDVDRPRNGARV